MAIFEKGKAESIDVKVRLAAADALGSAGDPRIWDDLCVPKAREQLFILIPEGEFKMGAEKIKGASNFDKEAYDYESPVHLVRLGAFKIGKYPVTVAQYKRFIEDDGYLKEKYWKAGGFGVTKKPDSWESQEQYPNRPIVDVSWYEAKAFCQWADLRLPTEAEWERAAGGPGPDYRKYPWGNETPDEKRLNFGETGIGHCSPVGLFPSGASREGLHDLAGNVWEWCEDLFGAYSDEAIENPHGASEGPNRVLRGGGWYDFARYCRSAFRFNFDPESRIGLNGFRCVLPRGHQ